MNILDLLKKGQTAINDAHEAEQQERLGYLRIGTFGIVDSENKSRGNCLRIANLRKKGISTKADWSTHQMFQGGFANEEIIFKQLRAALPSKFQILREKEIPINWIEGTTKISGSPDIVIKNTETGKMIQALELKAVCSVYTAKSVHYELKPKSNHLIQAAAYSWRLSEQLGYEVPYEIVYASRVDWYVLEGHDFLKAKKYDLEVRPGRKSLKILPFVRTYTLQWAGDTLEYWTEGLSGAVKTEITKESLKKFALEADKDIIHPRPSNLDVEGKRSFKPCDYCDFKKVCDSHEDSGYETWLNNIRKELK